MIGHAPIMLAAVALPIAGCPAEAPAAPADPCAVVKQRYAAHRENAERQVREIQVREEADIRAGKSELERSVKFREFMAKLEGEEMRYQVGMRDCGGTPPRQKDDDGVRG